MIRAKIGLWGIMLTMLLTSGCTTQVGANEAGTGSLQEFNRHGYISYPTFENERLNAEQEQLLVDYMDLYYQSLADLIPQDSSSLFAEGCVDQALIRLGAWETIIDVRKAQPLDLTMAEFSYELMTNTISFSDDGTVSVSAVENSVNHFNAFADIPAEAFNVRHRFTLGETAQGWKLRSHMQIDSTNWVASGSLLFYGQPERIWGFSTAENATVDIHTAIAQQHDRVLTTHTAGLAWQAEQAVGYNPSAYPSVSWRYDYNRETALAYAMHWVGRRNLDPWTSYDGNGGNCQNYVSQALNAGGVPMDYNGSYQWKYFGPAIDNSQSASGRSSSWAGVNEFYSYAQSNTGYGLAADAEANYWVGEVGDLILLGYEGFWRHVVIITYVIRDEEGDPVDYLINSNTADLRNFPLSTYMYPERKLIKIYGWND